MMDSNDRGDHLSSRLILYSPSLHQFGAPPTYCHDAVILDFFFCFFSNCDAISHMISVHHHNGMIPLMHQCMECWLNICFQRLISVTLMPMWPIPLLAWDGDCYSSPLFHLLHFLFLKQNLAAVFFCFLVSRSL